jgi:phosphatidyl-myo-inositol alpha-mannosyltransferase
MIPLTTDRGYPGKEEGLPDASASLQVEQVSMKIGIVTEYYYPLLGGITENVHNTKIRLEKMGHEVKIITSHFAGPWFAPHTKPPSNEASVIHLGRTMPIYANGSFAHLTVGRHLRARMRAILETERFDILHVHSPIVVTLPLIALVEAKCPIVGTFHTYFDRSLLFSLVKNGLQRGVDKLDGKIVVSQNCLHALRRYFNLNARVIPNGVDIEKFSPSVLPLERFSDEKTNLLFLSRFDPRNGLALMLRAFEIVKSEFDPVRLIVVGDGPLRFYYKQLIPKGLQRDVYFEGVANDTRPRYYASCDIFCSPVTRASFGITLLEAMAAGKPIVATKNPGYEELLSPDVGFLLPPNDPIAFARAILSLLRDSRLRKEMGATGRNKALAYSWDNISQDIVGYYDEILKG